MKNKKPLKIWKKSIINKDVAAKYKCVPKNTLSTWVKNKAKGLEWLEKGSNIARQKLRTGNFELVDKAIHLEEREMGWNKLERAGTT